MKGSNGNTDKVKKAPQIIELLRCSLGAPFLLSSLFYFFFFFLSKLFFRFCSFDIFFSSRSTQE
jgi:hypothetical protein